MSIQSFPVTLKGETAAFAVPDPKNVVFANGEYTVFTESDYIAPVEPDSIDVVIQAEIDASPTLTFLIQYIADQAGIDSSQITDTIKQTAISKQISPPVSLPPVVKPPV